MKKAGFLKQLRRAMRNYPSDTVSKTLDYYDEIISDRIEEGLSEEQAVAAMESIDKIISAIPENSAKQSAKQHKGRKTALLILGFPIWFPLLIAGCAVLLALFAVMLALIISLSAVMLAIAVSSAATLLTGIWMLINGNAAQALTLIGGALCAGGLCCISARPFALLERTLSGSFSSMFRQLRKQIHQKRGI